MRLLSIRICSIGNMLGRNAGYITTQGQILADLLAGEGYDVTCVSSKINRFLRLMEIIKTLVAGRHHFDMVLLEVYSGLNFIVADIVGRLCRAFKIPMIMVLHGGELPEHIQKYPRWTKKVLKRGAILVAPSPFLAEKIGEYEFQVRVIPNIIDIEKYPFCERSKISPQLIWMRSFHPIYNPEMAVKVLCKLKGIEPSATLIMAGVDKGLEDSIKEMVEAMNLTDSVQFTGFLDLKKKLREFRAADVFINTNRVDNMPVSVVEARASGLPVVATNVGGLRYLIQNGEDGMLVENDDVEAMVGSINTLLKNPELTRKISQNGRAFAESSAWTNVCIKWESLFSELIK
jgi:glycosyltransferase involved in cell wall biosynthesis